jgi:hypothetical protein
MFFSQMVLFSRRWRRFISQTSADSFSIDSKMNGIMHVFPADGTFFPQMAQIYFADFRRFFFSIDSKNEWNQAGFPADVRKYFVYLK